MLTQRNGQRNPTEELLHSNYLEFSFEVAASVFQSLRTFIRTNEKQ